MPPITVRPKGTADILPVSAKKWKYIEDIIHSVCARFGFGEVRTPVFEHTELFERGVGDGTDVVSKEMYTFLDKGKRSITLRPEGTASAARCYLENNLYAEAQPVKLYYLISCYRYEKPQAGRFREFNQFGVEAFGSHDPSIDAEIISLAVNLLEQLSIKDTQLLINSIGCPVCRAEYNKALREFLTAKSGGLCETCNRRMEKNPMRVLDCKSPVCKELVKDAPRILDNVCPECTNHFNAVKGYLDTMDIPYSVDPSIVRGLDYYTKTVFEISSSHLGAQSALCGGGRYDGLMESLGGNPSGGVGFALGLERLIMIMEGQGCGFPPDIPPKLYIASIGFESDVAAQKLVYSLRKNGVYAEKDLCGRSLKAQMKYADKIGAEYTLVIGENEISAGCAALKNMKTGEKTDVAFSELQNFLK